MERAFKKEFPPEDVRAGFRHKIFAPRLIYHRQTSDTESDDLTSMDSDDSDMVCSSSSLFLAIVLIYASLVPLFVRRLSIHEITPARR